MNVILNPIRLSVISPFSDTIRSWRANKMWPLPDPVKNTTQAKVHAGFWNLWSKSDLKTNVTNAVRGHGRAGDSGPSRGLCQRSIEKFAL